MIAWTIFYHPVSLGSDGLLWLVLPLCLSVAVIYKTVRTGELRRLPVEIVACLAYMAAGMVLLGAALWVVQRFLQ